MSTRWVPRCTFFSRLGPPFQAASTAETIRQVLETNPVSPQSLNPNVPKDLEDDMP